MMHHRFIVPVLPLLFLLSAEGALAVGDALAPRVPAPRALGALALLALVAFQVRDFGKDLRYEEISGPFFEPKHADRIGRYLAEHLPPDELVAIEWGGIIPLHIPNDCLDTWGLTDLDWALNGDLQKLVWGTNVGPWLLAKRAPDLIVCNCRILPTEEAARKSVQPGGPNHYRYYPQMVDEKYGYRWKFFELGPNAWWPALVKRESEN